MRLFRSDANVFPRLLGLSFCERFFSLCYAAALCENFLLPLVALCFEVLTDVCGGAALDIGFRVLEVALEVAGGTNILSFRPPPIQLLERCPIDLGLIATGEVFEILPDSG